MTTVDWLLLPAIAVFAWSGYRQGFVAGVIAFSGYLVGGLAAARFIPQLLESTSMGSSLRLIVTAAAVLASASLGNAIAAIVGQKLRSKITWDPGKRADAMGGLLLNVTTLAVFAWVVASTIAVLPPSSVTTAVRQSSLLGGIDAVVPDPARVWFEDLHAWVDTSGLPRAFAGLGSTGDVDVAEPDPKLIKIPAVKAAWNSLVKVEGEASACRTSVSGSGFVIGPNLVMTNAHVVAGVREPEVLVRGNGEILAATTVYWDPKTDVAVLRVPELNAPALKFVSTAKSGAPAVIAGFPGGGPLTAVPARIRTEITARGTDIYGKGSVLRDVYAVRGKVKSGNSGGPLLTPDGDVYGFVFAASLDNADTGYSLTAEEVRDAYVASAKATRAVSTGRCTKD